MLLITVSETVSMREKERVRAEIGISAAPNDPDSGIDLTVSDNGLLNPYAFFVPHLKTPFTI